MKIDLELEGMDELEEQLRGAIEGLLPSAAKGLEKGLARVETQAKDTCPRKTGQLRESIHFEVEQNGDGVTGTVGSAKEYSVYVEMGTGDVGRASGGNGSPVKVSYREGGWFMPLEAGKDKYIADTLVEEKSPGFWTRGQPARPYLWPAWKANKQKVIADIQSAVKKGLR